MLTLGFSIDDDVEGLGADDDMTLESVADEGVRMEEVDRGRNAAGVVMKFVHSVQCMALFRPSAVGDTSVAQGSQKHAKHAQHAQHAQHTNTRTHEHTKTQLHHQSTKAPKH